MGSKYQHTVYRPRECMNNDLINNINQILHLIILLISIDLSSWVGDLVFRLVILLLKLSSLILILENAQVSRNHAKKKLNPKL